MTDLAFKYHEWDYFHRYCGSTSVKASYWGQYTAIIRSAHKKTVLLLGFHFRFFIENFNYFFTPFLLGAHFQKTNFAIAMIFGLFKECAQKKNGPTYNFYHNWKNEFRYIVSVSHLFQNPCTKYHCNNKISFLKMS